MLELMAYSVITPECAMLFKTHPQGWICVVVLIRVSQGRAHRMFHILRGSNLQRVYPQMCAWGW